MFRLFLYTILKTTPVAIYYNKVNSAANFT